MGYRQISWDVKIAAIKRMNKIYSAFLTFLTALASLNIHFTGFSTYRGKLGMLFILQGVYEDTFEFYITVMYSIYYALSGRTPFMFFCTF
ncbi:hypothetical protein BJV74DRAFT_460191 [Russula compacta]|nr:hypothetical protein BJV74DRAFT_460191 [Russula compacta]